MNGKRSTSLHPASIPPKSKPNNTMPSETGHAKNAANFKDVISFCTGYGAPYNPAKAALKLAGLNTKATNADATLATVNTTFAAWTTAVNARDVLFAPFTTFVSRIVNAVFASDVNIDVRADVKTIAHKLTGRRAKAKAPAVPAAPGAPPAPAAKTASASQISFDSRIENFSKLIELLTAQPGYTPNETDLKLTGLSALLTSMKTTNAAVVSTYTALSNARIARNKELYDKITGLVEIANEVKNYVKSLFGPTSPQFKQLSKIKFHKIKL